MSEIGDFNPSPGKRDDSPLMPRNPIVWIDADAEVGAAVDRIRREPFIGLDVETTLTSPPKLCTVQIGLPGRDYVFDALAISDLGEIFRLMEDPGIMKIIHYAPFERGVFKGLGVEINNVLDTFQVSRQLRGELSRHEHSLNSVCRRELGHPLNKFYQKSDWTRRPLSPGQLRYAALDAEVLLSLYDIFRKEIT
jgi:ribonuclease D